MIEIVPAILPETFDDIHAKVARVRGLVHRVQIDIVDGIFAPSKTWPYVNENGEFVRLIKEDEGLPFWDEIDFEVDMMVKNPEDILDKWIAAGVSACIIHIESTNEHSRILQKLREANVEVGWALKPSTLDETLFKIIDKAGMPDFVQVMGNDTIGHAGVELDEYVYAKVAEIRAQYPELPIAVDIGVNEDTAIELMEAGATKLVAGSAIFGSENAKEAIESLKELL